MLSTVATQRIGRLNQGCKMEMRQKQTCCHSALATTAYVAFFSQVGAASRVLIGELFSGNCSKRVPGESLSWIPCVASSGVDKSYGGALFRDLPANMIGCFIIGILASTQTLKILFPSLNGEDRPLAAAPARSNFFQNHPPLLVRLRRPDKPEHISRWV